MIPFPRRWFSGMMAAALGVWLFSAWTSGASIEAWVEHGIVMLAMSALGLSVYLWRPRYVERVQDLNRDITRQLELPVAFPDAAES